MSIDSPSHLQPRSHLPPPSTYNSISLSSERPLQLLVPRSIHPRNIPHLSGRAQPYRELERVVSHGLKGNKICMAEYRRKQQLKTQSINNHNVVKSYLNRAIQEEFMPLDQSISHSHHIAEETVGQAETFHEFRNRNTRPRTGGVLTADPTLQTRKRPLDPNPSPHPNSSTRSRTMIVTSNATRPRTNPLRLTNYFISSNLDNKMNDFMNLMIRNQGAQGTEPERFIGQIHTEGVVPHCRKLNNFQRRMRIRRKGRNGGSNSKEKVKINLELDVMDMKTLSKTLQTISMHNQSPLVTNLEHKTIFGRLSTHNSLKKPYFGHRQ